MLRAFFLALGQMTSRHTLGIALKTAALTLAIFALLAVGGWAGLRWLGEAVGHRLGAGESAIAALVIAIALGWVLFRAIAMIVVGLFTDAVVEDVERRHYPDAAARAAPPDIGRGLALGMKSAVRAIGYNLLAMPLYVWLLVTGVGTLVVALAVNGLLLGKDLEAMVLARHRQDGLMQPMPRAQRLVFGVLIAALFLIPGINLFAPLFGAAMAVHLVHRQGERSP